MISAATTAFDVRLVNAFRRPFDNAVATARTCYSAAGIIDERQVGGDDLEPAERLTARSRRDALADSIFQAGHHTPFQHVSFQFALSGVSRHFIWSFLHAHPFYNSEQVSQRYVKVAKDALYVPALPAAAREVFLAAAEAQMEAYHFLRQEGQAAVAREYFERFRNRRGTKRAERDIEKRSQEAARYVLPVATTAYLYHTVSGITLLRYKRLLEQFDTLAEQRAVVGAMVEEVQKHDPDFAKLVADPLPLEATPEFAFLGALEQGRAPAAELVAEFDASLEGRVSKLIDWKGKNEEILALSVREVLGAGRAQLSDDAAIALALDPGQNHLLGETLNLSTHSKLTRALFHPSYTFRKRLSHTADSQDQRHRMTPASRPVLTANLPPAPDFVRPALYAEDETLRARFDESMARTWEAIARLERLGASAEARSYLLPNAVAIRFTESSDLLALRHKHALRLCYNAQEEIWRASRDESDQIIAINPRIGRYLLPPCSLRALAGSRPICPEGDRYCGVPVWRKPRAEWRRTI
ncbi:MAG: FAD-dependent thymidylate synthase [Planctomycetes bacterium]|nr:FAD-dependent thymidylate synthase [Planctomycetota bacterium]